MFELGDIGFILNDEGIDFSNGFLFEGSNRGKSRRKNRLIGFSPGSSGCMETKVASKAICE